MTNVKNLAASLRADPRYLELKVAIYESQASRVSHEAVAQVFVQIEEWADEGQAEKIKAEKAKAEKKNGDPQEQPYVDLDDQ